ncbi:phage tail protein [Enterobacter hormaechei]|nr:phage tail protein [Enterobacter hormaechei]
MCKACNGAHVYLASGYGPAITFTGATNAEHAVITVSAADDIAVGDIVHVNCNWSGIDNVIAKIDAIAENAVTLRNINTTNKNKYAAGGGSGSIRKIEEWTELPQITEVSKSGGDQNTTQIQFLSDDRQRNLNTYKSAVSQTYSIAHDSTLPVYPLLRQLDEDEETVAAYMYVPKAKENRYWAATASFDDTPATAVNEVETVSVVLNLQSPAMTFYKVDSGKTETVAVSKHSSVVHRV